ncbi:MAG: hypothetical protein WCT37_04670 [Patescibacteria group bacterium]|jgi:hypothetical protein
MFKHTTVISPIEATRQFLIRQLYLATGIQPRKMEEISELDIRSQWGNIGLIIADISIIERLGFVKDYIKRNKLLVILTAKEIDRWKKSGFAYPWLARPFSTTNLKKAVESLAKPRNGSSARTTPRESSSRVTGIRF